MAKLRHVAGLLVVAVLLAFVADRLVFGDASPLITRLDGKDRADLYKQVSAVAVTLFGFIVTAVAILVALDRTREIVKDLRNGEGFALLVVNLLAAAFFLFLLVAASVVGAIVDDGNSGAAVFERFWEMLLLVSLFEVSLGGFYFGLVTYKTATHS